ncbi:MAG: prepilin peptidase [Desulfobacter sp.]
MISALFTAQYPIVIQIFAFVFGACIGSFMNVVIFRLPENKSVVFPSSHCPDCGHPLPFYLNLPILSYLYLKGRCGYCSNSISIRYPVIECLTGGLALLLLYKFNLSLPGLFWFFFGCVLIVVSFIDLDHQIIPDRISIPGIAIFASSPLFIPEMSFETVFYGIAAGGGILYAIALSYYMLRKQHGMGGGDIKLLAMIGAATGIKGVLFTLFTASVLGTACGVAFMVFQNKKDSRFKIPFGPFLSLGALIYIIWGEELIFWYFSLLAAP